MSLYDELLRALERDDPHGDDGPSDVEGLRREVVRLRRLVARLAAFAVSEERLDPELLRRLLLGEIGAAPSPPKAPAPPDLEAPTYADSPYRGSTPDRPGELRCHRCRRKLEPDDPELSAEEGRVCFACFQRGSE